MQPVCSRKGERPELATGSRRILRAKINAMPWHVGLPPEKRKRLIGADVDRWWHLEVKEAARRLLERLG